MPWKKDVNTELDDEQMSRINSAGIINITLENLWRDCYSAMATGKLVLLNRKLDAIWTLLGGDVTPGDDTDKEMQEIDLKIYEQGSLNPKKKGFETHGEGASKTMAIHYVLLKKKALFLRRLQNAQGKGTAYVDHDYDDFD